MEDIQLSSTGRYRTFYINGRRIVQTIRDVRVVKVGSSHIAKFNTDLRMMGQMLEAYVRKRYHGYVNGGLSKMNVVTVVNTPSFTGDLPTANISYVLDIDDIKKITQILIMMG